MKIKIDEIKINAGRRESKADNVHELAKSIAEIGLLNPITVTADNTLIAGRHRLEAAKMLGWTEIECTVCEVDGLLAELAEIDENMVRTNLSPIEFGDLLLKRKQIYETLHPETKNGGDRKSEKIRMSKCRSDSAKSFVKDTADKLGVSPRTVERQIQVAKNLTPEAKEIIQSSGRKITKESALKLSRLEPEQQQEAAQAMSDIEKCLNKYRKHPAPYSIGGKHFNSFEESIADLKNSNKDTSYSAGTLLADMDGLIDRFHKDFVWYSMPMCTVAYQLINQEQLDYITERFEDICNEIHELLQAMKSARAEK